MRLRIFMLALASFLLIADGAHAQWGRGVGGGNYSPYSGLSFGIGGPNYYGYSSPYYGSGYYNQGNYYQSGNYYYGPSTYYGQSSYYLPSTYYGQGAYNPAYYGQSYNYIPGTGYVPMANYAPSATYSDPSRSVTPVAASVSAPAGQQITEVVDGSPAKKAGLRTGDIIIAIGSTQTLTFEDLQQALARSNGKVEVSYRIGTNVKTEKTMVTPKDGKIGVSVTPVN